MKSLSYWLLLFLFCVTEVVAAPLLYPSQDNPRFVMDIPDGWQVNPAAEGRVQLVSPSTAVVGYIFSVTADKDRAINLLVAETEVILANDVDNPSYFGGFVPVRLNGMSATQLKARGDRPSDGRPMGIDFLIFNPSGDFWALFHAFYREDTSEEEQRQLVEIFKSIEPV